VSQGSAALGAREGALVTIAQAWHPARPAKRARPARSSPRSGAAVVRRGEVTVYRLEWWMVGVLAALLAIAVVLGPRSERTGPDRPRPPWDLAW
jgi:hypothetical protein